MIILLLRWEKVIGAFVYISAQRRIAEYMHCLIVEASKTVPDMY
jgi:hypothetical protein